MRRIATWIAATVVGVVLLFTYRTSTAGPSRSTPAAAGVAGIVSGPDTAATGSGDATTVVNGTVAQTQWGPVQVQVKVKIAGNQITDVVVLQQPDGNRRDQEINDYALPLLRAQVLQAQSATINGVSGATVTTDGYRESLQAALATVHFGG